jgi:hypothetical protein
VFAGRIFEFTFRFILPFDIVPEFERIFEFMFPEFVDIFVFIIGVIVGVAIVELLLAIDMFEFRRLEFVLVLLSPPHASIPTAVMPVRHTASILLISFCPLKVLRFFLSNRRAAPIQFRQEINRRCGLGRSSKPELSNCDHRRSFSLNP